MSRHHKAEELFIPELMIQPEDTDNKEFRRCFKLCVKDLTVNYLDQKETECSQNCLNKYFDASHFLSQKQMHYLNQLIMQDPSIKRAFGKI